MDRRGLLLYFVSIWICRPHLRCGIKIDTCIRGEGEVTLAVRQLRDNLMRPRRVYKLSAYRADGMLWYNRSLIFIDGATLANAGCSSRDGNIGGVAPTPGFDRRLKKRPFNKRKKRACTQGMCVLRKYVLRSTSEYSPFLRGGTKRRIILKISRCFQNQLETYASPLAASQLYSVGRACWLHRTTPATNCRRTGQTSHQVLTGNARR